MRLTKRGEIVLTIVAFITIVGLFSFNPWP